ncbi:hypothetical protein [Chryseobacterium sp. JK1]|uniref:hypothetical protein n=1 Tax=Chryseobacterium sp. JK1 TaxID=874294 RepID=UPI003D698AE0
MLSLLEILKTEYSAEMPKVPYKLPKINHGGEDYDLSKRWYVYYSYVDPKTRKMERQPPIYMNVNRDYSMAKERLARLKSIKNNLAELLKKGYSPYPDTETKESSTIKSALEWAYEMKIATLSETSVPDYRSKKNQFIKYLEKHGFDILPSDQFPKKYLQDYLNEIILKNSGKTHNNHKVVLSSLFDVLKKNELISNNFVTDIDNQSHKPEKNKSYLNKQLDELFEEISKDKKLLLFIQFVSYNFLRPIEVTRLKYEDLKINEPVPYLEVKTKNKPLKTKIIPNVMLLLLKEIQFGIPWRSGFQN